MSADARRAGPARQRAAAAWPPRAAPTRARIKRCRDGAASRQHSRTACRCRLFPTAASRRARRSRPPPHAACPPPDRACPSAPTPSSTPSPVAAPLSPHRRRPSPPVSRRLPAGRGRAGPRQRCARGPCPAWPRARSRAARVGRAAPPQASPTLCDWAELGFGPVHPVICLLISELFNSFQIQKFV